MKTMNYNSYPDFQENQILSHNDLNSSFKYLNEQGLLTRANLIGTGIVCGLHASFKDGKVSISNGYGVTSYGYYIKKGIFSSSSCECDVAKIDTVTSSTEEFGYARKIECNYLKSFFKNDDLGGENVYELLMKGKPEEEISKLFQNADPLQQYSVFLLYEEKINDQACNSCGGYKGLEKTITIRQLLVPLKKKSSGKEIPSLPLIDRIAQRLVELPEGDLNLQKNAESLNKNIDACYNYEVLNEILNNKDYSAAIKKFNPDDFKTAKLNHYNFLCDLTEAYEEFRQCGEKVLLDYRPAAVAEFPCHLVLNGNYRHHFRPATASSDDYSELNRLWKRIVTMIDSFDSNVTPATDNSIRLTPSVYGAVPLSEKAVPYYYKKTDVADQLENQKALNEMHKAWTDRKNKVGYWYDWYNKSDINYLNYDLEKYNFVRIEGHIDKPYNETTIKNAIKKIADDCHLPIEVIALKDATGGTDTCNLEYQKRYFLILRSGIHNSACRIISKIVDSNPSSIRNLDKAVREVKKKAEEIVIKAGEVVTKAEQADATSTVVAAARKLVEDARKAAEEVTKEAAEKAKEAAEKAKEAAEKAKEAVATITDTEVKNITKLATATENAATTLIAAIAIDEKELLPYLTKDYEVKKQIWEKVVSFACQEDELNDPCQKIISFLHWLDATHTRYEQCKEFSSFDEFKEKHPGLQHKSGVPIGGTFILVYNDQNKIIADFCLPYRVTQPD